MNFYFLELIEAKIVVILKYISSKSFDTAKKFDSEFLKDITVGDIKYSYVKNKSSAIILTNLGEFYHNMRDYKRSQIFLNITNLYFEKYDKEDILFYKNYSFIALNNFHITKSVNTILIK